MKCNSVHKWSDATCILEKGHEGPCTSKAVRSRTQGTITRAEWWCNKDGTFKSHHQYVTKYPMNAARMEDDK